MERPLLMSGRFTFTAGNTLTAAQLNTNVMDGIPFKMVAGTTAAFTGSLAITWPSSFPVAPIMTANVATSAAGYMVTCVTTTTGATIYVWTATGTLSAASRAVGYQAICMTPTTAAGNS
jgi:hypothetical protein